MQHSQTNLYRSIIQRNAPNQRKGATRQILSEEKTQAGVPKAFQQQKGSVLILLKINTVEGAFNEALLKCAFFKDFSLVFKFSVAFVISSF